MFILLMKLTSITLTPALNNPKYSMAMTKELLIKMCKKFLNY
jgi:hypothetical protein